MSQDIESVNPTTMQTPVETQASAPVTRREQDSIGEMDVPIDAYYGVQSLRAQRNFPGSSTTHAMNSTDGIT